MAQAYQVSGTGGAKFIPQGGFTNISQTFPGGLRVPQGALMKIPQTLPGVLRVSGVPFSLGGTLENDFFMAFPGPGTHSNGLCTLLGFKSTDFQPEISVLDPFREGNRFTENII